jgi:capsular polysaccharide biosynthesis protein
VELETLTLAQQIGLFANARAVCGLHGAGFTNLLWCRPGCVAVELLADNFLNGCYESLASCVAVEHRFLIQPADELQRIRVDIKQLARLLPD